MARLDDLGLQFGDTGDRGIEVVDFKHRRTPLP
jgi:hypothetical protein